MKKISVLLLAAVIALAPSIPARAQDAVTAAAPDDKAQRRELAEKVHEYLPAVKQLEDAIGKVAQKLPEKERKVFTERLMDAIDVPTLEEKSIASMADVFTVAELERMVSYYSSPESKTIAEKWPLYHQMVQPEVTKMLDKALMELRLGSGGKKAP